MKTLSQEVAESPRHFHKNEKVSLQRYSQEQSYGGHGRPPNFSFCPAVVFWPSLIAFFTE